MAFWAKGLIALAIFWALQVVGTWVQMRHYRTIMRDIGEKWPDGSLGASAVRGYLGKGVIAIVVASPDEIIRDVHVMEGRSVFAKFKSYPDFCGSSLSTLETLTSEQLKRARFKAIAGAIAQIRRATRNAEASGNALVKPMTPTVTSPA
ncbi:hypothetical protein ACELLULO517_14150 [Acidisoma cellulosilytica]|uniref:Uncharacterized protein n=1 Tax=Acidisoma cellulosilyticum TaxID=2802395 RepID=A0A964E4L3_9PROT|nr:transcriptional regulator GutM [Acidisoma cellulosilyticum]MCB8881387.1 hypothetical protein [Acidisoma cellulosilyticum]